MAQNIISFRRVEDVEPPRDGDGEAFALDDDLVPTPLRVPREIEPVTLVPPRPNGPFRNLRIVGRLIAFKVRSSWRRFFLPAAPERNGRDLRELFESFGGLWVKLGQLLSLRTDMFSEETCRELGRLQHRAEGFPSELAIAQVESELGGPVQRFFARFDPHPFAAASISQVHRAVLRGSHEVVVVKVRRPGIEQTFHKDMQILRSLCRLLMRLGLGRHLRMEDALWELEQMMREELDYRYEASNLERMRKSLKPHGIHVPRPILNLSTRAVVVMEFVPGVLMSDYIALIQAEPERVAAWCRANGVRPKKVAQRLFISAIRQLIEDNLFHADLHPGNIMLLRDSRVALIDLGTIGSVEREFVELYMMSTQSLARRDFSRAADYMLRLCPDLPSLYLVNLRRDLVRCYRLWEARTHLRNVPYHEKALSSAGTDSGRVLFNYGVQPSWTFMRISRTWATLDASMQFLIPDANYMKLFQRYFENARRRTLNARTLRRQLPSRLMAVFEAVREYDLLLKPLLRNEALALTGSLSKLASIGITVVRGLLLALVSGFLVMTVIHVDRFHQNVVGDSFAHSFNSLRQISYGTSFTLIMAALWMIWLGRRVLRLLRKPDAHR